MKQINFTNKQLKQNPDGSWLLRKKIKGEEIKKKLTLDLPPRRLTKKDDPKMTSAPPKVVAAALKVIAKVIDQGKEILEAGRLRKAKVATIGEIIEIYRNHDRTQNLAANSLSQNINCLCSVIATVYKIKIPLNDTPTSRAKERNALNLCGSPKAAAAREEIVSRMSSDILTGELIEKYVSHHLKRGPKISVHEDRPDHLKAHNGKMNSLDKQRVQRTIKTVVARARALFCEKSPVVGNLVCPVEGIYKAIRLPDTLDDFRKQFVFKTPADPEYELPESDELAGLWGGLIDLKTDQPEVYKAFKLACDTGLRLNEIRFLMWSQIRQLPNMILITVKDNGVNGGTKSRKPRKVKLSQSLYDELVEMKSSNTYVIGGTHEFRKWHLGKEITAWMRSKGWDRRQGIHEMRKWFGAQVAFQTNSLLDVMRILGHKSYRTTQGTYEDMVSYPEYGNIADTLPGAAKKSRKSKAA
tara:strand:+ start:523 stop:1929 length:1407 start_codon:yes stop_codon:yes gene_type:complete